MKNLEGRSSYHRCQLPEVQPRTSGHVVPSCIYFYDDIMDMRGKSFDFNHVAEFLVDNFGKLDFKPQPETTVALHYHTGREQGTRS
ncbi:MAG: hypothetical protein Ct9H300mP11_28200 [Chloroflexota bacterium]|nr:MAG: hypothetical protein Ct9H300mP11_28200 [Chloroflexota bacterium]